MGLFTDAFSRDKEVRQAADVARRARAAERNAALKQKSADRKQKAADEKVALEYRLLGFRVDGDQIQPFDKSQIGGALAGAKVTIETAGELEKRVTATRVLALGLFAMAAKKKQDNRTLYCTVEGADYTFVSTLNPLVEQQVRKLAARFNTVAARAAQEAVNQ